MVAVAVGAAVCVRPRRVVVTGDSMRPALAPGDRLLVVRARSLGVGDVVAVRDPRSPDRVMVKRVADVEDAHVRVLGDNPDASTDSRHFGPVPSALVEGRAVYRYGPADRVGPVRRLGGPTPSPPPAP